MISTVTADTSARRYAGSGPVVPEDKRRDRDGDDDRDEDRRDTVGQPLDRCLGPLGRADQSDDVGEDGVAADPGGAHAERPVADSTWRPRPRTPAPSRPAPARRSASTRPRSCGPRSPSPSVGMRSPGRTISDIADAHLLEGNVRLRTRRALPARLRAGGRSAGGPPPRCVPWPGLRAGCRAARAR